ncbi:hypothetical protein SELMODRAFT_438528 [Selaginella moellendorffii]|uniref:Serine/threonine-protein phosphatase n=1 Tax=Selaginella moellendorffii TaxID=88036 RepID=D8QWJ2_SELML|nr:serine/threonine-protein phosphatase BSL1 homolog [Selaginella moellendorffii]EFJ35248.1 hypothetical protein SELMODRAFT_438528 [Selaginella moellendorffii]|eukprot:XP_002963377.1 serine/threonine-protein phosphatase BSL1 homolog [Selaginella moellendorffii]
MEVEADAPVQESSESEAPKEAEVMESQDAVSSYRVVDAVAESEGDWPGPRCGHTLTALAPIGKEGTAVYIAHRLVLFGGATALEGASGTGPPLSPSSGDPGIRIAEVTANVHCFDTASKKWQKLNPSGIAPSPRAAHAAAAVGPMVVFQGGIGPAGLSSDDLHVLDLSQPEAKWHRVVVKEGPRPGPRYGHVMALVAQFLILVSGNDGVRLFSDVWVLDTTKKPYQWEKVEAGGDGPPPCMYAAASTRKDGVLLFCGGRDSIGVPVPGIYRLVRNQIGHWHWDRLPGTSPSPRYQHAAAFADARFHISGGAQGRGHIVDDASSFAVFDTISGVWYEAKSTGASDESLALTKRCRHAAVGLGKTMYIYGGLKSGVLFSDLLVADDEKLEAACRRNESRATIRRDPNDLHLLVEASAAEAAAITAIMGKVQSQNNGVAVESVSPSSDLPMPNAMPGSDVRLHHRAIVATEPGGGTLRSLVRQLSLDRFENEGLGVTREISKRVLERQISMYGVHKKVLALLLKPREWKPSLRRNLFLEFNEVLELCDSAENIFRAEPNVLKLKAPVKIFGDIHGQFGDLMRLFNEYGSPSTAGDISYIDYLFLGDYVDRGQHSLETIFLLLALKIEHPEHVHMIRGNHEAQDINALFGFRTECVERMGEWEGVWAWHRMNQLFNWLPLAAVIEEKIICMHGGIGKSINHISQIDNLVRPITMDTGSNVLMDLLWSDPTENDSIQGIQPNARGPGLVTFGPDRVMDFCNNNNLDLIIRAHECVMDGFERFAQGHLITLFSATNYCGTANNAGALLVLGRDLVVVPKLIHPLPPFDEDEMDVTWMQELNAQRPPTPTRGRPPSVADRSSLAYI